MSGMQLQNIVKHYPGNIDLTIKEFSLDVAPGEFIVLVGPSGCGKSTVLRIIAGLIEHTKGDIMIAGKKVSHLASKDRDVSMVFQNYALFPHMTVRDNLAFGMKIRKEKKDYIKSRLDEVADILQLRDLLDKRPSQLSGGQRQRVALGRAMVRNPKVFLFDEPLSNFDAKLRGSMRREILEFHRNVKGMMVYVTHDQLEAMTMANRIVVLDEGVIQQVGTPDDIYERPINLFVAGFIGTPPMNFIEGEIVDGKFISPNLSIPLSSDFKAGKVTLGIRAEDIYRESHEWQGIRTEAFSGIVRNKELLGDCVLVEISLGSICVLAKFKRDGKMEINETVNIVFDTEKIHLFDENGYSI